MILQFNYKANHKKIERIERAKDFTINFNITAKN